ncbi:Hypothetical protein NTJ_06342 [Nesidiocoris tenuis]|uniref:Uncharacterized protein n=1 Tax=Nesidiocoris tenuis TaxID=355587 RepID=A0ABN7ANK0_9HEMI|nr:Hypothetical protein NTJ_06342 [Nesidiocoris tenuis]
MQSFDKKGVSDRRIIRGLLRRITSSHFTFHHKQLCSKLEPRKSTLGLRIICIRQFKDGKEAQTDFLPFFLRPFLRDELCRKTLPEDFDSLFFTPHPHFLAEALFDPHSQRQISISKRAPESALSFSDGNPLKSVSLYSDENVREKWKAHQWLDGDRNVEAETSSPLFSNIYIYILLIAAAAVAVAATLSFVSLPRFSSFTPPR